MTTLLLGMNVAKGFCMLQTPPGCNTLTRFHPETLFFADAETAGFQFGNEHFFLLARKSSNYEEAYINTLTK